VSTVAGIYVINYALTYIFNPLISRAINQYGERVVLSLESGSLILLFTGYALIDSVYVVIGLFLIDNVFMNFSIGLNTYLQKTADKKDLGSLTAVGFTINHLSAVFIPLFGGFMWLLNWKLPFLIGACLTFISLIFTQMIKTAYHHKGKMVEASGV
jgi:MFS family permease